MKSSNKTLDAIKDDAERYILISWSTIVLFASLIGDTVILIETIKYKAIRQHKLIVSVIQHLAVCDLLLTVFRVFPENLALITDHWILGELLCHLNNNIGYICGGVTVLLTCCLTTLKLVILKRPLRAGTWTTKLGHKICAAMWLLALCQYTPTLVLMMTDIRETLHFSYREYNCNYDHYSASAPTWYLVYGFITFLLGGILSYTTMLVTSTLILVTARRSALRQRESVRWKGITTVVLTVVVLLVSFLPTNVVLVSSKIGVKYSSTLWRTISKLSYLNIMANFFIYSLTVPSFREFLKLKMSAILSTLRQTNRQRVPQRRTDPRQAAAPRQNILNIQDTPV